MGLVLPFNPFILFKFVAIMGGYNIPAFLLNIARLKKGKEQESTWIIKYTNTKTLKN